MRSRKVVEGIEGRGRTVVYPGWVRAMLILRGVSGPLLNRGSGARTAEMDAAFARDVAERGAETPPSCGRRRRGRAAPRDQPTPVAGVA